MPKVERIQYAEDCVAEGHEECTAILVFRVKNTKAGREFYIESISHGHRDLHIECRIGDALPEVEDRRGGARAGPTIRWRPQCDDCLYPLNRPHPSGRFFEDVTPEESRAASIEAAVAAGVVTRADVEKGWD